MHRLLDILYVLYFASHIVITVVVDSQAVIPSTFYPKQLVQLKEWYCQKFRDPMMMAPPAWFQSFCACELIFQFPLFFVAAYAFWKGASNCQWIRVPIIVYGSHVATTVIAIACHVLFHDFSDSDFPGPRNIPERLTLLAIYAPYLVFPLILLLDGLFSSTYQPNSRLSNNAQSKKKR